MTSYKFPNTDKLKSRSAINELFRKGKAIKAFPVKLVFTIGEPIEKSCVKVGVSVPKKNIRKAVDRNLLKRRIRESYRLNSIPLKKTVTDRNLQINMMFVFLGKDVADYKVLDDKIKVTLSRLIKLCEEDFR